MFDLKLLDESHCFTGESAIITGAAQGLGLQIAASFAARGANVLMADLNEGAVVAAASELDEASSGRIESFTVNVSDPDSVASMVSRAIETFDRINHMVNNAGALHVAPLVETLPAEFARVMAVNATGVYLGMRSILPHMMSNNGGSIVNIASICGKLAMVNLSAYCASKAAVLSLTQSAALEAAPHVRINAVSPGVINTAMQQSEYAAISAMTGKSQEEIRKEWLDDLPMGRFQRPIDIAEAVCFLSSSRASQITGEAVAVNGGLLMD